MPKKIQYKMVFDKSLGDYYSEPKVVISGGTKLRNGKIYYSETLIRAEFESKLALLLKK
jgi:hypothetical protein|tara:strand:- start:2119 stop:2295 length:177 start_codon:yes stop_codon:yes gene_type:complete